MADSVITFNQHADSGGMDIILGSGSQSTFPIRLLAADGKTVLWSLNAIGNTFGGAKTSLVRTITASGSMSSTDTLILADATAGPITLTLVTAGGTTSRSVSIIKIDSTANAVTIVPVGGQFIDGLGGIVLEVPNAIAALQSNGVVNWYSGAGVIPIHNLKVVAGTYAMVYSDEKILADATAAAFAVTLPPANFLPPGYQVSIEKLDVSGNAVTVTRHGADTIEGATTVALAAQYNAARLTSDGTSIWYKGL